MNEELTLTQQLDILRKENLALKSKVTCALNLKVSEKGAISIYGLGRFPVTLYKSQMTRLLAMSDDIQAFILKHSNVLTEKA